MSFKNISIVVASSLSIMFIGCSGDSDTSIKNPVQVVESSNSETFKYIDAKAVLVDNIDIEVEKEKLLTRTIQKACDDFDLPSIQVVIKSKDKLYVSNAGVVNLITNESLTNSHKFKGASITKTFTATLILRLYEMGLLNLDDKVLKYKDELKIVEFLTQASEGKPNSEELVENYLKKFENVTIKDLLNHTAGMAHYTTNEDIGNGMFINPEKVYTKDELFKYVFITEIENELHGIGSWHYSNNGYVMLARIAEIVTGKEYSDLMEEMIVAPLNLENTTFPKAGETKNITNLARGYYDLTVLGEDAKMIDIKYKVPNTNYMDTTLLDLSAAFGNGDVVSNAIDLAKWFDARVRGDFLLPDTKNLSLSLNYIGDYRPGWKYGMGWYEIYDGYITHRGQINGYECGVQYNLKDDTIFAMCTNKTMSSGSVLDFTVFPMINSAYYGTAPLLTRSLLIGNGKYIPLTEY